LQEAINDARLSPYKEISLCISTRKDTGQIKETSRMKERKMKKTLIGNQKVRKGKGSTKGEEKNEARERTSWSLCASRG
jgi:hypothetical protein